MPRLKKKTAIALGFLVTGVVLYLGLKATKPSAQVEQPSEPVFSVRAVSITPQERAPTITLYGRVTTLKRATLTAAVNADVALVPVRPGNRVSANDLLIQLDPAEAQIAFEQAQADLQQADAQLQLERARQKTDLSALSRERRLLTLAESEVSRLTNLQNRNLVSDAQLDATKKNFQLQALSTEQRELTVAQGAARLAQLDAQRQSAEARLRRAELDLQRTSVRAPFAAAVIQVMVSPGDRVAPGQALTEIYDNTALEVRAQIPNRFLHNLRQGLNSAEHLAANIQAGADSWSGALQRLAASGGGGGVDGYFALDSVDLEIDTNVTVTMDLPSVPDAVPLPFEAIYDLSRIYRYRDGRLNGITVQRLGDFKADGSAPRILVHSPQLQAGDQIVVTHLPNAVEGLRVQLIE